MAQRRKTVDMGRLLLRNYRVLSLILLLAVVLWSHVGPAGADLLGSDPLIDAVERGNLRAVQKALLEGSSANVRGEQSLSALMLASNFGAVDIVELLLSHGAIVDLAEAEGNTALIYAAVNNFDDVIAVLLAAGAAIDHGNRQGKTALMRAAQTGGDNAVSALLAAGADSSLTDFTGRTALDLARENRRNRVIRIFHKADVDR